MKNFLPVFFFLSILCCQAQEHACAKAKRLSAASQIRQQARAASINSLTSHELEYDVRFVHLNLNLERNSTFISGEVTTVANVTAITMDTFMLLLHQNHTIDSLRFNGLLLPAIRQDSMVKVKLPVALVSGSTFTVNVFYNGTAPVGGAANGSGFSTGLDPWYGNSCTWSLSESLVAYHWWPCKQILTDKIDSSWVFVITDSANKVGSNGLLKNVVTLGNKKRYEWKSRTPIAYYLISVAVAKYKEYDLYAKPQYLANDSILIQNYVYDSAIVNNQWIYSDKIALDQLPQVINLYCNLYGMYPFRKEKYGHCMAPIGGGMEHQTMTSLLLFEYYLDAHELGHQWWGDNVTCKGWGDIWMNEGFAVYSEYLSSYYLDNLNFAGKLTQDHALIMSLPGGSVYFQDTLNANSIFDSRLTYAKGGSIIRSLQFVTNDDSLWFNTLRGFQAAYKNSNASVINFRNYYQAQTNIDPTQFFNQWYYGEGYPIFTVRFDQANDTLIIKSTETTSKPSSIPLFITPMEYKIRRNGKPDTVIRVMQNTGVEIYKIPLRDSVVSLLCDPNNWIINKLIGPSRDPSLNTGIPVISATSGVMSLGPNPGLGIYALRNPSLLSGKVSVWDLSGKLILEKKLEGDTQIDLSPYAHGLYEVRAFDINSKEIYAGKIIKE